MKECCKIQGNLSFSVSKTCYKTGFSHNKAKIASNNSGISE